MFVLIYFEEYATDVTYYWHATGWTTDRRRARRYSESEAEPVVRRMIVDNVKAKTTPPTRNHK